MTFPFSSPMIRGWAAREHPPPNGAGLARFAATASPFCPDPDHPGERYCARCEAERAPRRRVHMNFQLRERWCCSFLEEDLKTTLPRRVSFATPEQMLAFAERGGAAMNLEDRQVFEHGLSHRARRYMAESDCWSSMRL